MSTCVYELPSGALVDAGEAADTAAAAVRALNHLTPHGLDHPCEVYAVLGALAEMAHRLPQACAQLAGFLDRELDAGRMADEGPTGAGNPRGAVRATAWHLEAAHALAVRLGEELAAAQQACAGLAAEGER